MPEYLMILLGLILVSFLLQKRFQIRLFENKKQIIVFYLIMYAVGVIWDNFAIWRGHWNYPGKGLIGVNIGLAPIEDYIFLIACSYFALVLYKLMLKKY